MHRMTRTIERNGLSLSFEFCYLQHVSLAPCYPLSSPPATFAFEISYVKSRSEEGDHFVVVQVAAT